MAKKKVAETTEAAEKIPPPTSPFDTPASVPDQNGQPQPALPRGEAKPGTSNGEGRKPLKVLTYQVNLDAYVQASIWDRPMQRKDGVSFTAYDVTVRKRIKDSETGEFKSVNWFAASELYAVVHALEAAAAVILELRSSDVPF